VVQSPQRPQMLVRRIEDRSAASDRADQVGFNINKFEHAVSEVMFATSFTVSDREKEFGNEKNSDSAGKGSRECCGTMHS
jgi:hypothetical protein